MGGSTTTMLLSRLHVGLRGCTAASPSHSPTPAVRYAPLGRRGGKHRGQRGCAAVRVACTEDKGFVMYYMWHAATAVHRVCDCQGDAFPGHTPNSTTPLLLLAGSVRKRNLQGKASLPWQTTPGPQLPYAYCNSHQQHPLCPNVHADHAKHGSNGPEPVLRALVADFPLIIVTPTCSAIC